MQNAQKTYTTPKREATRLVQKQLNCHKERRFKTIAFTPMIKYEHPVCAECLENIYNT